MNKKAGNGGDVNQYRPASKLLTFSGAGGASANLFQITGIIELMLFGEVKAALNADVDNVYFDLFPTGGAAIEITDNGGGGVDISSAPIGSFLYKGDVATAVADYASSALGFIRENTQFSPPTIPFTLGQKVAIDTFIRLTYSGVGTDGSIDFYALWKPLSSNGLLIAI